MSSSSLLVIGLGNPGAEFEGTRHNVGAASVEHLIEKSKATPVAQKNAKARVATTTILGTRVVLAIPTTYMNESGLSAATLVRHYLDDEEMPLDHLVVIHDELDLDPGVVRLKFGGGTAGHNGLKSLGQHLHSFGFARVRIGVGKPPGSMSGADYVLRRVPKGDREILQLACERAVEAVELIVSDGLERAMNLFNTR
jgi:PTH1 family peptidyl-tRNA hydrolase